MIGGSPFTTKVATASGGTWLNVSADRFITAAVLSIRVNPTGLNPGTYSGTVDVVPADGSAASPVVISLTVLKPPPILIGVTPAQVPAGSDDTTITLTGSGFETGAVVKFNGIALFATTTLINANTLRLSLSKAMLRSPVSYSVAIENVGSPSSNALIFTIGNTPPQVSPGGVVNAASYTGGAVAPGEIVTVFGVGFGTEKNTRIFFDGDFTNTATLVYATPAQLSVTIPYGVNLPSTSMVIESESLRSAPVVLPVVRSAPAIFTVDASGKGQGAILNENASVNSAANPSAKGSVVVFYGTGGGALTAERLPRLASPVSVTIGGINAEVLYAGIAPGLVQGAIQVNARIPVDTPSGSLPVVLQVGDGRSPADVTLSVQ